MNKIRARVLAGVFVLVGTIVWGAGEAFYIEPISNERLSLFPNPPDYRNYFFLQSIGNSTSIIIGDFTGRKRLIVHLIDENSDNTIDKIYEYYPDIGQFKKIRRCSSQFFTENIAQLKKDIIEGKIFRDNYSYKMQSLDSLLYKLEEGFDINHSGSGYTVQFFDPDPPSTQMSEFYFNKIQDRYDLQFRTNYYKIFNLKIIPPIPYSVYCKNSKDPVVAEVVESLLKEMGGR
ncbi:MAG: hypothetical protein A2W19_07305 [Spirochaetes bacterium RBG_16_49_21]|nr:MAG: hypothetical protein A2W19_07305 [Spirochaetes bacterium RBG_16_49_21]